MYESPLKLLMQEITTELIKKENEVCVRCVQQAVPNVTEEELIKALQYDRGQYDKGFSDGREARDAEIVRCKDCKHRIERKVGNIKAVCELDTGDPYELGRNAWNDNWFCADGERREDAER